MRTFSAMGSKHGAGYLPKREAGRFEDKQGGVGQPHRRWSLHGRDARQEMTLMDLVAIDFEASCLPRHGRSFPIEVGIASANGVRSWLIKPDARWRDWDWTDEAFALHGISRAQLNAEGHPPDAVLAELHKAIGSRRVFADSTIDSYWWDTLGTVTCRPLPSPIEHANALLDEWGSSSDTISAACQDANRLCPAMHRAAADARWLWTVLSGVNGRQVMAPKAPERWSTDPILAPFHQSVPDSDLSVIS
ncbi:MULTISPECIES: 3'-5' exonuclease [Sphingomonadaceae]|uniref:3'-5' exonuclease n=1 Tax=Sphingomonadales TaxID=204457 RepID=UPI000B23D538|nr:MULTISPECIES: hypothetical protein [Sphingomonadaceae]